MKYLITILTTICLSCSYGQNINWSAINKSQKNLAYLNLGYDFGVTSQIGYGHKIKFFKPLLLTADYSFPMGKDLVDDFKIRLGAQVSIYKINNFVVSAKVYCVFRRHETEFVRMASFGSETALIIGYYKQKWHIAGEFGLDKSAITHLKHSDAMRENFPSISNGWFSHTGGHFFYGIQSSKTIEKKFEISIRIGGISPQIKDAPPLLPFYAQLGLLYKFSKNRGVQ